MGNASPDHKVNRRANEEEFLIQEPSLVANQCRIGGRDFRHLRQVSPWEQFKESTRPTHPHDRQEQNPHPAQVLHECFRGAAHHHTPASASEVLNDDKEQRSKAYR